MSDAVKSEKFPLKHVGFGRYEVNGVKYESKAEAVKARELLLNPVEDDLSDIIPEGIKITDRTLEFRGSLLEVPMNEMYLPDGDVNPFYDRAWYYGWAAYNGVSIASFQQKGYHIVKYADLKELDKNNKVPEHYLSLLRRDGDYLVYGDLVLMRIPRVLWRQRQREKFERDTGVFNRLSQKLRSDADNAHIPIVKNDSPDEVVLRL